MSHQRTFSHLLLTIQVVFIAFFVSGTTYNEEDFQYPEYIIYRDIMAMLLLGFGYLMTFLASYGLGAVGFTMFLTGLSMQMNVLVEYAMRALYEQDQEWPMPVSATTIIDAEFAAATLLITFGALIGRATPLQMFIITIVQSFFYALNKVIFVFGMIEAEDVGGTITIHMFGAYFGLAASYALGPPDNSGDADQDKISDIFAFIGTGILWVFWPSFVGATETANATLEMRCVSNTVFALLASTTAAFFASNLMTGYKFDPVHIANATLAGGVAIGTSARLVTAPGGAVVVGAIAGTASVLGYVHISTLLEERLKLYDTCGVGNLHGIPAIIGAIASTIFIRMNPDAEFLAHDVGSQVVRQFAATGATLAISLVSGLLTGKLIAFLNEDDTVPYADKCWWTADYFETSRHGSSVHGRSTFQASNHSHAISLQNSAYQGSSLNKLGTTRNSTDSTTGSREPVDSPPKSFNEKPSSDENEEEHENDSMAATEEHEDDPILTAGDIPPEVLSEDDQAVAGGIPFEVPMRDDQAVDTVAPPNASSKDDRVSILNLFCVS